MDRRYKIFPVALVMPDKGDKSGELTQAAYFSRALRRLDESTGMWFQEKR
jgi:hypothetical protein